MGLGLPLALLGLVAIAAPIVIHLLRQRDVPRRVFPAIALLERAVAESRRRLRLRDRLLLLLRALALAAFALGVARPFVVSSRAFDDGRLASLVLVIDDSASMSRRVGRERLLEAAVQRALDALDALPEGSEATLVLAGRPARVAVSRTTELAAVRRALLAMPTTSARGTDLAEAIELGGRALAGASLRRRVLVLSDFAAHAGLTELPSLPGTAIALERVGGEDVPTNDAILDARGAPDPTTPGRVSIQLVVRGAPGTHEVEVLHGDRSIGRGEVVLATEPGTSEVAIGRATLHVPEPEIPDATLRLVAGDALDVDDARGVLLRPPAAVRALLVDGEPHVGRDRSEVGYLARALDAAPRADGGVAYRIVDADAVRPSDLAEVDVVVLANVAAPSARVAAALAAHVRSGGGLLVTAGERVDPHAHRQRFGDLLPAVLGAARALPEGTSLRTVTTRLPALDGATLRRVAALEPAVDAEVWAETGGGDEGAPALVVAPRDDGHVAVLATTLDDEWSDAPYQPGYLPFVVELVRTLAGSRRVPGVVVPGGEELSVPEHAQVLGPDGTTYEPQGGRFVDTHTPGVYRAIRRSRGGEEVLGSFVVAPPAEESDITPAPLPSAPTEETNGAVATSRRPVDPWFFLFGGLCLIAEGFLRTRASR
ncbi:MAG: VWA domain-containing protein [Myxococcales bacterium]|nr:VWA domain-containing protein [Myxococcales bacterium]